MVGGTGSGRAPSKGNKNSIDARAKEGAKDDYTQKTIVYYYGRGSSCDTQYVVVFAVECTLKDTHPRPCEDLLVPFCQLSMMTGVWKL